MNIALTSNRDVQKALADIEAARAQFGETRASLFPTLDVGLSHTRSRTVTSGLTSLSEADGVVSSFELDLFGKNQSLTRAARKLACQRIHRPEYASDDDRRSDHRVDNPRCG